MFSIISECEQFGSYAAIWLLMGNITGISHLVICTSEFRSTFVNYT